MKKSPKLAPLMIKMRPIMCNTDLAFIIPEQQHPKVNMKRRRQSSEEQVNKVRSKHQELFQNNELNQEYWFEQMTERMEKYQISKQRQLANKAKYAKDYNFKWRQKLHQQKWEFYFQELHWQQWQQQQQQNIIKKNQRSKSLALPPIVTKKTEQSKKEDDKFFSKLRKIVFCSYQRELKQMKRSFEIASKLDHDDQRIMKYKTLDCRPKLGIIRHNDDTFLTQS